jgi:hypothetical protein
MGFELTISAVYIYIYIYEMQNLFQYITNETRSHHQRVNTKVLFSNKYVLNIISLPIMQDIRTENYVVPSGLSDFKNSLIH